MKRKPLEQANFIKSEFSKYVKSTFVLENNTYRDFFHRELDKAVFTKGPFLKLDLPFVKGRSLNQLIESGKASPLFKEFKELKLDRALYWHQEESFKLINEGENVVVTTGTGSGKTEAFLYPIFNQLLRKIESNAAFGIQALFLYPMNALVNDQLERLRELLKDYPKITFGYFTGDTKENYKYDGTTRDGYIKKYFTDDEIKPPANERLTREEIREKPPHILITNYSMLEYLLVRPKDKEIFNKETLYDWSFMVLDEAHTYRGTLATEISHLLRRLKHYAGKEPQFILTSATLGSYEKDKPRIVKFAEDLTSSRFKEKGIIFAKRIPIDVYKRNHYLKKEEYELLLTEDKKSEAYLNVLKKYKVNNLFDLLKGDQIIHALAAILEITRTFDDAYGLFNAELPEFNERDFENVIELVTSSDVINDDGLTLYDIKYHLFIRTLEGAFISLEPNQKLEITNRKKIDDMWAFEVSTCRYCNTLYIVGKEYRNNDTGEHYIYRTELDLDENYEFYDDLHVDFYLIKDDVKNKLEDISEDFYEYVVCSKCGLAYDKDQNSPPNCECGSEYKVELLKIKQKTNDVKNNLTQCKVCAKYSNKWGVLNRFKIGKDQATALISQMLLQSMDFLEEEKETESSICQVSFFEKRKEKAKKDNYKQFLAFSDSRQQASFYALFLQENLDRFLRKALVLKHKDKIRMSNLINHIETEISEKNLLNDTRSKKFNMDPLRNAMVSVLRELFNTDGVNSLEGMGLISFEPNLDSMLSQIKQEHLEGYLSKVKIEQLKDLLCIVTDNFRTTPAIHYGDLTYDQRTEYLNYRRFQNYITLQKAPAIVGEGPRDPHIRSLFPVRQNSDNSITDYFRRAFELTTEQAKDYIRNIWQLLINFEIIQQNENHQEQYFINLDQYKIINGKDIKWFKCDKCNTLTAHNINETCIKKDCPGTLKSCDPEIYFSDNYYYEQYLKKNIDRIIVEEHTGQIDREEASKLQKRFKNNELNILSSSTTFEMGVDIGSLSTVFMRNIPPTNANYSQRAGRAGRSVDSVGFIVTYVNNNSHDQIYFNDPKPMIDGIVNPPVFSLDNKKITLRHIMAFLLGEFYRGFEYSDKVNGFLEVGQFEFMEYIKKHKNLLEKQIIDLLNDEVIDEFSNYKWYNQLKGDDSLIKEYINKVEADLQNLEEAKDMAINNENFKEVVQINQEIEDIKEQNIVESFSKYNVIPSYGFPINVVPLKIFNKKENRFDRKTNLTRELAIAISEYAPGSEVVVDKQKFKSQYIILPKEKNFLNYQYLVCENKNCNYNEIKIGSDMDVTCPLCQEKVKVTHFIEPVYGFISTDTNLETTILKPAKTYSSEIVYLGKFEEFKNDEYNLIIDDFMILQRKADDKLLILNENPFFYCLKCGYTELNKEKFNLPYYYKEHPLHTGTMCNENKLVKTSLGHIMITDVIKMRINIKMNFSEAISALTAIKNGIISYLQIDVFDINGTLMKDGDSFAFILYDTTYGGSGNVKQLFERNTLLNILDVALESVSGDCCTEDVSCPNCLRNYYNRNYHSDLIRGSAKNIVKTIINKLRYSY